MEFRDQAAKEAAALAERMVPASADLTRQRLKAFRSAIEGATKALESALTTPPRLDKDIQQLVERLTELARADADAAARRASAELQHTIDDLRARLQGAHDEHTALAASLQESAERVTDLEQQITEGEHQLQALRAELTRAHEAVTRSENARAEAVEARDHESAARTHAEREVQAVRSLLDTAQAELASTTTDLEMAIASRAATEEGLQAVEATRRELEITISQLSADLDANAARLRDLDALASDRAARLQALEDAVAERDARIDALQAASRESQSQVSSLEASLVERASRADALESALADRETQVMALQASLTERSSQVRDLESALADGAARAASLESALGDNGTRFAELESALAESTARVRSLETTLAESEARATSMESSVVDGDARVTELQSALTESEARVTSLQSSLDEIAGRASAAEAALGDTTTQAGSLQQALEERAFQLAALEASQTEMAARATELETELQAAVENTAAHDKRTAQLFDTLLESFQALDSAATIADVLNATVTRLHEVFSRVALFRLKSNHLEGEHQIGFDQKSNLGKIIVPLGMDSLLTRAATTGRPVSLAGEELEDNSGLPFGTGASWAIALPVLVHGEPLAVVYADNGGESVRAGMAHQFAERFAQALLQHAGTVLMRLTAELKAMAELRDYARSLFNEIEEMFVADSAAGKPEDELTRRLSANLEYARSIYATRVAVEGPGAASLLEDELQAIIETKGTTPYGRALASLGAPAAVKQKAAAS
jgi:chromosome segregation ATPase